MRLSLHHLTVLDATPVELIEMAGALGVASVCLFTHVPEAARGRFPMVAKADVAAIRGRLGDAGVSVANLEVFPLDRSGLRADLDDGLAVGAGLGATRATAHLHDVSSEQDAIDRFAAFAEQAARYGIIAGLEFNNFSAIRSTAEAERVVRGAGAGSIVLDMLHAVRGGDTAKEIAHAADLIAYAQLCDGPATMLSDARWHEAVGERLCPGDGEFPLVTLAGLLHDDTMFDVEVPQSAARKAGVPAFDRARKAVETSRRLLAIMEQERAR